MSAADTVSNEDSELDINAILDDVKDLGDRESVNDNQDEEETVDENDEYSEQKMQEMKEIANAIKERDKSFRKTINNFMLRTEPENKEKILREQRNVAIVNIVCIFLIACGLIVVFYHVHLKNVLYDDVSSCCFLILLAPIVAGIVWAFFTYILYNIDIVSNAGEIKMEPLK